MATSRFASNGFAANGHADAAALRVCQGLEGASSPRRLEDSPAGLDSRAGLESRASLEASREEENAGRDEAGRFAKGCKGGPGNPYNRQVALLKRELLEAVTPEDVREIGKRLVAEAKEGSVAAARVLFTYVLPKGVEPDRVNMDEWEGYRQEQRMEEEMRPIMKSMEPEFVLDIVRTMRPAVSAGKARVMGHVLDTRSMDIFQSPADLQVGGGGRAPEEEREGQTE